MLYLDEWSATLVAPGHLDPPHPLAVAVRLGAETLDGLEHGAGTVLYNPPDEVERLRTALATPPPAAMFEANR